MRITILLACCFALSSACVPQRDIQLFAPAPLEMTPELDARRNEIARALVAEIKSEYGSTHFLNISAVSPRRYDFSDVVAQFGKRAAVPYTSENPVVVVWYTLEAVDGWLTGPGIHNYELTANLGWPDAIGGGAEIRRVASKRFRCVTKSSGAARERCELLVNRYAEELLYSFTKLEEGK